jgi:membrane-associated phospholipid phosphatase
MFVRALGRRGDTFKTWSGVALIGVWLLGAAQVEAEPSAPAADSGETVPVAPSVQPVERKVVAVSGALPATSNELTWQWRRAPLLEYVAAGVAGAGAYAAFYLLEAQPTPRWNSGILFDDAVRDGLRVRSPGARDSVRALSDITGLTTLAIALVVDSIVLPIVRGARFGTVAQILLMDVEAIALTSLATTITFDEVGRARPSYDECRRDPNFDPLCASGVTTSFFSGHTSQAFMAAGLSCAHHQYLKLYGDVTLDALACAGSLTFATATGTLRLMGDRHYATDVIVGALVGFGFGYGVPVLLHYSMPASDAAVRVRPTGSGTGLEMYGRF